MYTMIIPVNGTNSRRTKCYHLPFLQIAFIFSFSILGFLQPLRSICHASEPDYVELKETSMQRNQLGVGFSIWQELLSGTGGSSSTAQIQGIPYKSIFYSTQFEMRFYPEFLYKIFESTYFSIDGSLFVGQVNLQNQNSLEGNYYRRGAMVYGGSVGLAWQNILGKDFYWGVALPIYWRFAQIDPIEKDSGYPQFSNKQKLFLAGSLELGWQLTHGVYLIQNIGTGIGLRDGLWKIRLNFIY